MATIRKLRGRWQAQVRRRGMAPRAKSFDQKADAEKWARSLESELDRCGMLPDTRDDPNPSAIVPILMRAEIAWILKSEDKLLRRSGRPDPRTAYLAAEIELLTWAQNTGETEDSAQSSVS